MSKKRKVRQEDNSEKFARLFCYYKGNYQLSYDLLFEKWRLSDIETDEFYVDKFDSLQEAIETMDVLVMSEGEKDETD